MIAFSQLLQQSFRDYDVLGRLGGEEFAVCMPETHLLNGAKCCERFRHALANEQILVEHNDKTTSINITVSIGLACSQEYGDKQEFSQLLRDADHALYHAKENGRNQVAHSNKIMPKQIARA